MAKSIYDLIQIFKSSVNAVLPENLIRKSVKFSATTQHLSVLNDTYNLQSKNVYLVGTGKAVQSMAVELNNVLGSKIKHGIVSIPVGSIKQKVTNNIFYYEGAVNNLPDKDAKYTAEKVKELVKKLDKNDVLLVLISGGGSALLPLPKGHITLEEKTALIKSLANAGADITELNCVRKQISDIKGGQLAIQAQPAQVISLVLSDIVGDPFDLIASGPTVENKDDVSMAIDIIKKYKLFDDLPVSFQTVLSNDTKLPFPKDNVKTYLIGSNKLSINAAITEATNLNYFPLELSNITTGNVKDIASAYAKLVSYICHYIDGKEKASSLKSFVNALGIPGVNPDFVDRLEDLDKPLCLIFGGEITVEVKGTGKGGRNQQLALEFSKYLYDLRNEVSNFEVYLLSAGTDGIDGPTDAAGAIGYSELIEDCKRDNLDVNKYLENNDSYNFYNKFRNGELHVITGHTDTNVMDIHVIVIRKCK